MNSNLYEDAYELIANMAAAANAASPWDTTGARETAAATAAFYSQPTEEPPPMQSSNNDNNTKIILAGTQACCLATQVLRVKWVNPNDPDARITVACAKVLLQTYGIDIRTETLPDTEPPTALAPQQLIWPPVDRSGRPLTTTLPDVYRENYYHAREPIVLLNSPAISGTIVLPDNRLVLRDAYWNEEVLQWRMQFSNVSLLGEPFWTDHCKVRVGDEIPKVIDGDAMARSNDP